MSASTCATSAKLSARVLRRVHPEQACQYPGLFILEVAAALISVLAVRDGISGHPTVALEAVCAIGLWGFLLAIVFGIQILETGSGCVPQRSTC